MVDALNGRTVHSVWAGLGCAHLVAGAEGWVVVDTGSPGHARSILRRIARLGGGDIALIYLTHAHFDHYGSAAALRRRSGAPIAIHSADAEAMARGETRLGTVRGRGWLGQLLLPLAQALLRPEATTADLTVEDGDTLRAYGLDATVLHTPGHTPGSSSLIVGGRLAFAGDLISAAVRPHAQRLYADDWAALAHSLERLQARHPTQTYAGHGRKPVGDPTLQRLRPPPG
jgi:glyoxylase-like metal-dependent hydrolase (beta-lactamase superfamily II)